MRVKGTVKAWTTSNYQNFDYVAQAIKDGDINRAFDALSFMNHDMSSAKDWSEVGVATITVEFFPREAIVSKQIEGLREQLRQHRINAEQAEQAILSQISKLTAIAA